MHRLKALKRRAAGVDTGAERPARPSGETESGVTA
jgi:hypothetical protein